MFDPRECIGLPVEKAKDLLAAKGFLVEEKETPTDSKLKWDTTLVVRVQTADNNVILTTAKFLMKC